MKGFTGPFLVRNDNHNSSDDGSKKKALTLFVVLSLAIAGLTYVVVSEVEKEKPPPIEPWPASFVIECIEDEYVGPFILYDYRNNLRTPSGASTEGPVYLSASSQEVQNPIRPWESIRVFDYKASAFKFNISGSIPLDDIIITVNATLRLKVLEYYNFRPDLNYTIYLYEMKRDWHSWTEPGQASFPTFRRGLLWADMKTGVYANLTPVSTITDYTGGDLLFDVTKSMQNWKNGTWCPEWGWFVALVAPWEVKGISTVGSIQIHEPIIIPPFLQENNLVLFKIGSVDPPFKIVLPVDEPVSYFGHDPATIALDLVIIPEFRVLFIAIAFAIIIFLVFRIKRRRSGRT